MANAEILRFNNPGSSVANRLDVSYNTGTGTYIVATAPSGGLQINASGAQNVAIGVAGTNNVQIGTGSALATNAASGFIQVPTMAGSPSGTVGAAGKAAFVIDTTNKKLCYSIGGGTWECTGALLP
jgi:hypothetical protein